MPITDKNRLSVIFPDLVKEWCWDKNLINPDMSNKDRAFVKKFIK